ncbi:MAG: DUF4118 domain-containing protein [Xanthobacteraceae bacterium]
MRKLTRAIPIAVSFAVICLVTAALWYLNRAGDSLRHPVFFYLLPVALLAILYGRVPGLLSALIAAMCALYFLYDPLYTFYLPNRLEVGEFAFFIVLALFGVKCAHELRRREHGSGAGGAAAAVRADLVRSNSQNSDAN